MTLSHGYGDDDDSNDYDNDYNYDLIQHSEVGNEDDFEDEDDNFMIINTYITKTSPEDKHRRKKEEQRWSCE